MIMKFSINYKVYNISSKLVDLMNFYCVWCAWEKDWIRDFASFNLGCVVWAWTQKALKCVSVVEWKVVIFFIFSTDHHRLIGFTMEQRLYIYVLVKVGQNTWKNVFLGSFFGQFPSSTVRSPYTALLDIPKNRFGLFCPTFVFL